MNTAVITGAVINQSGERLDGSGLPVFDTLRVPGGPRRVKACCIISHDESVVRDETLAAATEISVPSGYQLNGRGRA